MPKINVNGVNLAYEVLGNGPAIVWTPGGWFPRNEWTYLSAGCHIANYQSLVWDRRNCGASDCLVEEAPTDVSLWVDDLHHLLSSLNMSPVYLAGVSAGNIFSLLMAHRYPADVKGIVLVDTPTNEVDVIKPLYDAYYLQIADVAEHNGMQAVIDFSTEALVRMASAQSDPEGFDWLLSWVAEAISMNPENHNRILTMDPEKFAMQMRKWGELFIKWTHEGRSHICGLSEEEVQQITAPALILHGFDDLHPREPAEDVHRLLPNSEWIEYSEHYSNDEINRVRESDYYYTQKIVMNAPIIESFLQRIESQYVHAAT